MGRLSKVWDFFKTGVDCMVLEVIDKPTRAVEVHSIDIPPDWRNEQVPEVAPCLQVLPQTKIVIHKFKPSAGTARSRFYFEIVAADQKGGWKVLCKSVKTYANIKQVQDALKPLRGFEALKVVEEVEDV